MKLLDADLGGPDAMGGGPPMPEVERLGGPPRGGGGVDFAPVAAELGSFLLTHFFSSGSYTNDDSSPSFALMGPVPGALGSFLPNQPPNQPDGFLLSSGLFAGKIELAGGYGI